MKYLIALFILNSFPMCSNAQSNSDVDKQEILKVRDKSNLAFKNHQIDNILSFLTEDINIAASNGKIISGKNVFKDDLTSLFSSNPDQYFVRSPEELLLNTEKNIAWEKGTWVSLRPNTSGWKNYGGSYSAYWVKINGTWKIKSELFVKLY
jgi:ketosteroid isomerase-like protein